MDFEALGARFSWILVPLDDVFWFLRPLSRDMRGACQVADLTLMIRATRGRSRRPNHMRSHIGSPKAMAPVDFRRGWGEFHSVANQASFYIAFWTNFGGFSRPKRTPKSTFGELFFDAFFERHFGIDFWSFWGGCNLKKSLKTIGFSMVFANFHKIDAFNKSWKKSSILAPFSRAKAEKIRLKMFLKTCNFSTSILTYFLVDLGSILWSKNHPKIAIFRKNWSSKAYSETLLL